MADISSLNQIDSPLRLGIKAVGVGKKGSRSLSAELAQQILHQLQSEKPHPAAIGAFFAGLICKGCSPDEDILKNFFHPHTFNNLQSVVEQISPDAPEAIQKLCTKLLSQVELSRDEAYTLGKFLMADTPGEGARGLAASSLRVRYETAEEYEGLFNAIVETFSSVFQGPVVKGNPIIQLAEPFDGVDHSYMITPCLAQAFQKQSYRVVTLVGRNSGPKSCFNLYDIIKKLSLPFLTSNQDFENTSDMGFVLDQKDLSPALDQWVDRRHIIIKRPFLATLEKFVNPLQADILITSAFHGVYGEKMIEIAERARFKAAIVVRNGIEGSLAFPLTRPTKLLCTVQHRDGHYQRNEFNFELQDLIGCTFTTETKLDPPQLEHNCQLISDYLHNGKSQNPEFDARVKATTEGITRALNWIKKERNLL